MARGCGPPVVACLSRQGALTRASRGEAARSTRFRGTGILLSDRPPADPGIWDRLRDAVETGDALRETSDALLRDLDVLARIEEEKRSLEPGNPRRMELAARIEEIAKRVLVGTTRQRDLTRVAHRQVRTGAPGAPEASIDETVRPMAAILADWRDAERRAASAAAGSADAAEANALVDRLRNEYRRAHEAVIGDR